MAALGLIRVLLAALAGWAGAQGPLCYIDLLDEPLGQQPSAATYEKTVDGTAYNCTSVDDHCCTSEPYCCDAGKKTAFSEDCPGHMSECIEDESGNTHHGSCGHRFLCCPGSAPAQGLQDLCTSPADGPQEPNPDGPGAGAGSGPLCYIDLRDDEDAPDSYDKTVDGTAYKCSSVDDNCCAREEYCCDAGKKVYDSPGCPGYMTECVQGAAACGDRYLCCPGQTPSVDRMDDCAEATTTTPEARGEATTTTPEWRATAAAPGAGRTSLAALLGGAALLAAPAAPQ